MPPITVVIAAQEKARRIACAELLQPEKGIRVVGEARNGLEVIALTSNLKPHILLLNLNLLKGKEISLLLALRQKSPRTKVILLTRRVPESRILGALSYGAVGYIEEKDIIASLPKSVRLVDAGQAWVPRKMVGMILNRLVRLIIRNRSNWTKVQLTNCGAGYNNNFCEG